LNWTTGKEWRNSHEHTLFMYSMILDNFVECKKKFENVVDMKKEINYMEIKLIWYS